jgi:Domain of unknown function (DUF4402)
LRRYRARILVVAACVASAASVGWGAVIAVNNTQALSFGNFVASSGGSVTVGASGARSRSGGVFLVPSGTGAAAQFALSGDPNAVYSIGLPINGVVSMGNGANSMAVNNFTSSPASSGQLGVGGSQTLLVGATLSVGANQASGRYSGNFSITVDYN